MLLLAQQEGSKTVTFPALYSLKAGSTRRKLNSDRVRMIYTTETQQALTVHRMFTNEIDSTHWEGIGKGTAVHFSSLQAG